MADEIFRLDTQPSGAPSGVTDAYMARITPNSRNSISPNVHMSQQSSTDQEFTFSPSGTDWWLPSRSYFRIRIRAQARVSKGLAADGDKKAYQNMSGPVFEEAKLGFNFLESNPLQHISATQGGGLTEGEVKAIMDTSDPSLTAAADVNLQKVMSRIVPAKGFCAALFDTATVKIGDTIVSKVSDNKMHQIDTFKKRSRFSSSQLEGTLGEMGLYQSKVGDPCNEPGAATLTEGYEHGRGRMSAFNHNGESNMAELMWQPPLGIFDYDRALPPSTYTIRLKTHSQNLLRRCVDWSFFRFTPDGQGGTTTTAQTIIQKLTSAGSGKQGTDAQLLDWGIEEIVFYAAIIQGPRADDVKYALDLMETGCTTQQVTSSDGDMTLNFDINSNTRSLGWALQGSTPHYHGDDSNFRYGLLPSSDALQEADNYIYEPDEALFTNPANGTPPLNIYNLEFRWFSGITGAPIALDTVAQLQGLPFLHPAAGLALVRAAFAIPKNSETGKKIAALLEKYPQLNNNSQGDESPIYPDSLQNTVGGFKADLGFHVYPNASAARFPNYDYKTNPGGLYIEVDFAMAAMTPGLFDIDGTTDNGAFLCRLIINQPSDIIPFLGALDGVARSGLRCTVLGNQINQGDQLSRSRSSFNAAMLVEALFGELSFDAVTVANTIVPWFANQNTEIPLRSFAFEGNGLPAADEKGNFNIFMTDAAANRGLVPLNLRVAPFFRYDRANCRRALPISYETNQLQSWYVSYDGKQYPSEHSQQAAAITTTTQSQKKILLKQRWLDTITQNGTFYTANQGEGYYQWLQNGPYYFMTWPRQGTANATRLIMNLSFKNRPNANSAAEKAILQKFGSREDGQPGSQGETDMQSGRVLLFYNYPTAFLIRTRDSRVVQVETPQNSDARFQSILD